MPNLTNPDYWIKRAEQSILNSESASGEMMQDIFKNYQECMKRLEKEVNAFYGKYSKEGGLSYEEAQKTLSRSELKRAKDQLKEYYDFVKKNKDHFDPAYKGELKLLYSKAYISRLEELQANIRWEIENMYMKTHSSFTKELGNSYEDTYYRTTFDIQQGKGYGGKFTTLTDAMITSSIKREWLEDNYSGRIWKNKDRLLIALNQDIPQGIILGHNPKKIARQIQKNLETSYSNAERLATTEFNHIANEASSNAYKEAGIDQYKIVATLDNRTSELCRDMDGKRFVLKDKQVGINFPPFHPRCRTTQIPYFPPDEIDEISEKATRIAKSPEGTYYYIPADMTYREWEKLYK